MRAKPSTGVLAALLLVLVAVGVPPDAAAAPGKLDPGFGVDGGALGPGDSVGVGGVVAQADGGVVVADSAFPGGGRLTRFLPDGRVDTSFAPPSGAAAPAQTADGKLLVAVSGGVARLRSDGSVDPSFGNNGVAPVNVAASRLAVDSAGRILVGGGSNGRAALLRLTPGGQLDSTFGNGGQIEPANSGTNVVFSVDGHGRIVVVANGSSPASLTRYLSDGTADLSFGANGTVTPPAGLGGDSSATKMISGLAVAPDGSIAVSTVADDPFVQVAADVVSRFDAAGGLEWQRPFNPCGMTSFSSLSLLLVPNGDLVISDGEVLVAVRSDGSLDPGFGAGGVSTVDATDLAGPNQGWFSSGGAAVAPDGAIVVAGWLTNEIVPFFNGGGRNYLHRGPLFVFRVETAPQSPGTTSDPLAKCPGSGYWLAAADGAVSAFGDTGTLASTPRLPLQAPIVGATPTTTGRGYWLVAADGGIFSFGDARFFGSTGNLRLNAPIVGMAATPSGDGYWLVARDGGIFTFGDAGFSGSTGAMRLNAPIVGMAATPSGDGYWLVARDGGIFAFGDAKFFGSTGNLRLNAPIVGMAAGPPPSSGGVCCPVPNTGYWLAAADGGIFTFGDVAFHGSAGSLRLRSPIVAITTTAGGGGYWLAAADGGIFTYGDATFFGTPASGSLNAPIAGLALR